jgi:hypothetical protein
MSAIVNLSLDLSKLPKEKMIKGKKGTYINLSLSVNDETNDFGQNASLSIAQTKEERDAKQKKLYVGNGKVIWTDGTCVKATSGDAVVEEVASSDLPF